MYVKVRQDAMAKGNAATKINGLRLPNLEFKLSETKPIMGLHNESQIAPNAEMVPAITGSTPAIVVRKNIKNDVKNVYDAESPIDADAYPSLIFKVSCFLIQH